MWTRRTLFCSLFVFCALSCTIRAVSLQAETALEKYEPRYIVDAPTAGMLENMSYSATAQLTAGGGFLVDFTAAIFEFANIGISYGGVGVISHEAMNLQKYPGFHVKFRLFNEREEDFMPAIALGFNSQGKGRYHHQAAELTDDIDRNKRYDQLAPDVYAVASKSFKWTLGTFSLNAGLNYAVQHKDDSGINFFLGFEHSITKYCAIALELNPNLNDNNEYIWKDGNPFMINAAIRVAPNENMIIEMQFKDMLTNLQGGGQVGRYFGVNFMSKFL